MTGASSDLLMARAGGDAIVLARKVRRALDKRGLPCSGAGALPPPLPAVHAVCAVGQVTIQPGGMTWSGHYPAWRNGMKAGRGTGGKQGW